MSNRLPRSFYERDAVTVAKALLGQLLVRVSQRRRTCGVIIETEAYLGVEDLAAHTCKGRRTKRNESMWGPSGHAYVYFTYGMHHCMNAVAGKTGEPIAVLIRAIEPKQGLDYMQQRRSKAARRPGQRVLRLVDLCSGPAKLCQAMSIDRNLDGANLISGKQLYIERLRSRTVSHTGIVEGPRVGVDYAGDWAGKPLRFYMRNNKYVSKPRNIES